jgi:hypothetical protein
LTISPAGAVYPQRAKTVKWTLVCIYLSLTLVFGMLALFLGGTERFLDINLGYFFAGISCLFFLGSRFKRQLGILFLTLIILFLVLFLSYLQYWECSEESHQVAEFRFLAERQAPVQLVVYKNGETSFYEVEKDYFAPVVTMLEVHDGYLFATNNTLYRLEGFNAYTQRVETNRSQQQQTGGLEVDYTYTGGEDGASWFGWLDRLFLTLPGIEKHVQETEPFRPIIFQRYALTMSTQDELEVEPVLD